MSAEVSSLSAIGLLRQAIRGQRRDVALGSLLLMGHQVAPALLAVSDRVIVIEEESVVAAGTHSELLRRMDSYRAAVLA